MSDSHLPSSAASLFLRLGTPLLPPSDERAFVSSALCVGGRRVLLRVLVFYINDLDLYFVFLAQRPLWEI